MKKTIAILLAAGKSERFGNQIPKPFLFLKQKPIYQYSLEVLIDHPQINEIILVVPSSLLEISEEIKSKYKKPIQIISGGKTRFESVHLALKAIDVSFQNVLIHDAARPFLSSLFIDGCLSALTKSMAVSCAISSTDTLAETSNNQVASFPNRALIKRIQTPQAFEKELLKKAFSIAISAGNTSFTDETSLIHHHLSTKIMLIDGNEENIKITHPLDLIIAEQILKKQN